MRQRQQNPLDIRCRGQITCCRLVALVSRERSVRNYCAALTSRYVKASIMHTVCDA